MHPSCLLTYCDHCIFTGHTLHDGIKVGPGYGSWSPRESLSNLADAYSCVQALDSPDHHCNKMAFKVSIILNISPCRNLSVQVLSLVCDCILDASTFFLTASAFVHPFDHLIQDETKRMVQGYLAYLNDNTNLISNPGILVSTTT